MRSLGRIYAECISDLKAYGITTAFVKPKLVVNTRAKKRWGQARYGASPEININARLLDESVDEFCARNTMMHEILHLQTVGEHHGGKWKSLANEVNRKSKGKYKEYGLAAERTGKYVFECSRCGAVVSRDRASNFTKNPSRYMHKGCGGKFREVI